MNSPSKPTAVILSPDQTIRSQTSTFKDMKKNQLQYNIFALVMGGYDFF